MNRWNLWLRRKSIGFRFAEKQEKRVNAADRRFSWIIELRVVVTMLSQLLHPLHSANAQIVQTPKNDRFGRANFCARRNEAALLPVVAKRALKRAAGILQRLRSPVDYSEGTRDDAIAATIANIVLD